MLMTRHNPNFRNWESKLMEIQKRPHNEGNVIYADGDRNFQITIVPDSGIADAYIKICNNARYGKSTKSIRLSFFKPEYIEYDGDNRELFKLDSIQIRMIIDTLCSNPNPEPVDSRFDTFWKVACHIWNKEWGFAYHPDYDMKLLKGCAEGSILLSHPQFVPLNIPMPDYTKIEFNN